MKNLEETLAKVLEKAIELAEKTGEFAMDQAPLLLQEFYMWHIASHIFYFVMFFMIILFGFKIHKMAMKFNEGDFFETPATLGGIIVIPIGIFGCLVNLHKLIFILVAPKLYIIEYFLK